LPQIDGECGTGAEKRAFQPVGEFLNLMLNTGMFNSGGGNTGFLRWRAPLCAGSAGRLPARDR
jgi:hypothetical protein